MPIAKQFLPADLTDPRVSRRGKFLFFKDFLFHEFFQISMYIFFYVLILNVFCNMIFFVNILISRIFSKCSFSSQKNVLFYIKSQGPRRQFEIGGAKIFWEY